MSKHPTPAGADGRNPTEHKQPAFGFTPPLGWVLRRTPTDSCQTRPTQATLTNKAHYQTKPRRAANCPPMLVKRDRSGTLPVRRNGICSFCHRYVACRKVRGKHEKAFTVNLLPVSRNPPLQYTLANTQRPRGLMGATRLNTDNVALTFSPPCCWVSR